MRSASGAQAVVNEVIADKDSLYLRPSRWSDVMGEEFLDSAFHFAHRADPYAKLFYKLDEKGNEFSVVKQSRDMSLVQYALAHPALMYVEYTSGLYRMADHFSGTRAVVQHLRCQGGAQSGWRSPLRHVPTVRVWTGPELG